MTSQLPPDDDEPKDNVSASEELTEDTVREPVECMGEYPDIPSFLRSSLEPHVDPAVEWILDLLDYDAVLEQFEGDTYRFYWQDGQVYRMG